MFIDEVTIHVKAGNGGDGCISFRREKYVPKGGPDGGDGGNGGNIILEADPQKATLLDFKFKPLHKGDRGEHGRGKSQYGRTGKDIILKVPVGTIIFDKDNNLEITDLLTPNEQIIIAKGGKGGKGNKRFANSRRQAPRIAEEGGEGEEKNLRLELKLIADVGIIGCPNAGKSTLLSVISHAHPKIADYPFTTKNPTLGVVQVTPGHSFVAADIPGLLEGAHDGTGLGDKFLRHIERTKILVHLIDLASVDGRDPITDYKMITQELNLYSEKLAGKPQIIVLNKHDLPQAEENMEKTKKFFKKQGLEVLVISAITHEGLKEVIYAVAKKLKETAVINTSKPKPKQ